MLPYAGHDGSPVILVEAPGGDTAAGRATQHHPSAAQRWVTESCDCLGHTVRETLCCAIKPLIAIVVLGLVMLGLLIYLAVHVAGVDQETVTAAATQRVMSLFAPPPGPSASTPTTTTRRYVFDSSQPSDLLTSPATAAAAAYYWHGVVAVNATSIILVTASLHASMAGRYLTTLVTHDSDGSVVSQLLPAVATALTVDNTLATATLTNADAGPLLAPSLQTAVTRGDAALYLALSRDTSPSVKLLVVRLTMAAP